MSSLKRSASLYATRSSCTKLSSQHEPAVKKSHLNHIENQDNPSNFLRNRFKTCRDDDVLLKSNKSLNLSISDCTCPICLEVLIEPVRMPCSHELCLPCFKAMTDQTNFLCPMCRMRISTWSRYASNTNTLVNMERWQQIQNAFPTEIKNRLEGKTADIIASNLKTMQLNQKKENTLNKELSSSNNDNKSNNCSRPGEIRKEYQEYLKREEERLKIEKETEEKLSLELIQQLIREEENLSLDDYLSAINSNQEAPTTSSSVNTRLFASLNNKLIKNSKLNETKLLSRPVLVAQSSQAILNNLNQHHTPVINTFHSKPKFGANRPSTSSSSTENDVPIALNIKLHPRNSIKKSKEDVKSIIEKLRQNHPRNIKYYENNNDSLNEDSNTDTIKRRLRSLHNKPSIYHQSNDTTIDHNNRSYSSSNDESANSSIVSTMSTMSLRSRRN